MSRPTAYFHVSVLLYPTTYVHVGVPEGEGTVLYNFQHVRYLGENIIFSNEKKTTLLTFHLDYLLA